MTTDDPQDRVREPLTMKQAEEAPETTELPADEPRTAHLDVAVPPTTAPVDDEPWTRRGIRMRTVVLGLVLLAVSGTSLVRLLTDVHVDDAAVLLTLLIVAGALLLGGGVASAMGEARAGRRRF